MNIPLIIPNFNLLTYTRNLVNWYRWYYPNAPIYIIDNGSTYEPLLDWYDEECEAEVIMTGRNKFIDNLNKFITEEILSRPHFKYYAISDPDIMPHPNTPPNFMEVFVHAIEKMKFHHAGFGLLHEEIPEFNPKKAWIAGDEQGLYSTPVEVMGYTGYKAPIDTTFAVYSRDNGGWSAPMPAAHWSNSIRLFKAYHLMWHLHPEHINEEMDNYFKTANYRVPGAPSAGQNNSRPEQYIR